jgi:hypothetical protein
VTVAMRAMVFVRAPKIPGGLLACMDNQGSHNPATPVAVR